MNWYEIEVNGGRTVKIPEYSIGYCASRNEESPETLSNNCNVGGIFKNGEWAWLARKSNIATIQIVSVRSGRTVSQYTFNGENGFDREGQYSIRHAEELQMQNIKCTILAIHLEYEYTNGSGKKTSCIVIYSVDHGHVLRCIELPVQVTAMAFINAKVCRETLLKSFDGCLAVGSEEGTVMVLEINAKRALHMRETLSCEEDHNQYIFTKAHIVDYNSDDMNNFLQTLRHCRSEDLPLALQMELTDEPSAVHSLLPIDVALGLAVGFADGRLAIYDLDELCYSHVIIPQFEQKNTSLCRMDCLIPLDDPRPCFYICGIHTGGGHLTAALHAFVYEKREFDAKDKNLFYFVNLRTAGLRLRLLLEDSPCIVLNCQAISTVYGDDDANSLCILSWHSISEEKNKVLIFDLNQWYKEEMPSLIHGPEEPTFVAGYILNGMHVGLQMYMYPATVAHFNSMQRLEEHFYPNSLSFDCALLTVDSCRAYSWEGAQNRFVNFLRNQKATIFLNPDPYTQEIIRTCLFPTFFEPNRNSDFSKQAMYELMLSVALEHNCHNLLLDCAKSWIDGSFICNYKCPTELSLSTLTNWIFQRAHRIRERCNELCKDIFDYVGFPLDQREQKELSFITRQLRQLTELQVEILHNGKQNIPTEVFEDLCAKERAMRIATEYQEVVNWLLYIGLLPETGTAEPVRSGYPFAELERYYTEKRIFFAKLSHHFIVRETGGCRLLYIDAFVDNCEGGRALGQSWKANDGNGLYPPKSIEALLRIMLVPEIDFENKCSVLLYFLLDLNLALDETAYGHVLEHFPKFQSVFKMSARATKTIQTFWHLDHRQFLTAIEDFISPLNKAHTFATWQIDLLVEALLLQNAGNQALCILDARPGYISPLLKLKTLLANEMISEAFHHARNKNHESNECLLEYFFRSCISAGRFDVLRDLTVSDNEGRLIERLLAESKVQGAENLHFVYLLQRSKYLEAVSYMDDKSRDREYCANAAGSAYNSLEDNTPNAMLTAYNCTVPPVTQNITDIYFRIRNSFRIKEMSGRMPETFSAQLIKQNANTLLGGIYHSSALSAHFATRYWGDMQQCSNTSGSPLSTKNAPFLRQPQNETNYLDLVHHNPIVRPLPYKPVEKRSRDDESAALPNASTSMQCIQPTKRRRLLGEEIVDDLKHFMQNKFGERITLSKSSFTEPLKERLLETNANESESCDFLVQPLPRAVSALQRQSTTSSTLPSILKPATPEHGQTNSSDEKYLRFQLPERDAASSNADLNTPMEEEISRAQSVASNSSDEHEMLERSNSVTDSDEIIVALEHEPLLQRSRLSGLGNTTRYSSGSDEFFSPNASFQVPAEGNVTTPQGESPLRFGPKARPSLSNIRQQLSSHQLVGVSSEVYAAFIPRNAQSSSGFGSFPQTVTAASTMRADAVNPVQSEGNEFLPPVSSSKVCGTQSKFTSRDKLSECTTVVGTLNSEMGVSDMESGSTSQMPSAVLHQTPEADNSQATTSVVTAPSGVGDHAQMLETTLGMSMYDVTSFETTARHLQSQRDGEQASIELPTDTLDEDYDDNDEEDAAETTNDDLVSNDESLMLNVTQEDLEEEYDETAEESADMATLSRDYIIDLLSSEDEADRSQPAVESQLPDDATADPESNYTESSSNDADVIEIIHSELSEAFAEERSPFSTHSSRPSPQLSANRSTQSDMITLFVRHGELRSSTSGSNSSSLPSSPGRRAGDTAADSDVPHTSLYRMNSLETVTELDTTKESTEEEKRDDDDECVVAMDGTEVRQYVPRVECNAPAATTDGPSISTSLTTSANTTTPSHTFSGYISPVHRRELHMPPQQAIVMETEHFAGISPDNRRNGSPPTASTSTSLSSMSSTPANGNREPPAASGVTSALHGPPDASEASSNNSNSNAGVNRMPSSSTSSSISDLSEGNSESGGSNGASSLPGSIDTSQEDSEEIMEHEHIDDFTTDSLEFVSNGSRPVDGNNVNNMISSVFVESSEDSVEIVPFVPPPASSSSAPSSSSSKSSATAPGTTINDEQRSAAGSAEPAGGEDVPPATPLRQNPTIEIIEISADGDSVEIIPNPTTPTSQEIERNYDTDTSQDSVETVPNVRDDISQASNDLSPSQELKSTDASHPTEVHNDTAMIIPRTGPDEEDVSASHSPKASDAGQARRCVKPFNIPPTVAEEAENATAVVDVPGTQSSKAYDAGQKRQTPRKRASSFSVVTPSSHMTRSRRSTSLAPETTATSSSSPPPQHKTEKRSVEVNSSVTENLPSTRSPYELRRGLVAAVKPRVADPDEMGESPEGAATLSMRRRYSLRGTSVETTSQGTPTSAVPTTPSRQLRKRGQSVPLEELSTMVPAVGTPTKKVSAQRSKRSASVPLITAGAASPNPSTPTTKARQLRRHLLEAITEDSALGDSPSTRTRSRQHLNSGSSEAELATPSTKIQRSTRSQHRDSPTLRSETPTLAAEETPRRVLSVSLAKLPKGHEAEDDGKPTTSRAAAVADSHKLSPSTISEQSDNDPDADKKSTTSTSSKRRGKLTATTAKKARTASAQENQTDGSAEYLSTRRMTRTQEKFAKMAREKASTTAAAVAEQQQKHATSANKRRTKLKTEDAGTDKEEDENVSTKSEQSNQSQRSKRRNTRLAEQQLSQAEDTKSTASAASHGTDDNNDDADAGVPPKKRGRRKK